MASITTAEANELNVGSAINQKIELGTEIKKFQDYGLVVISGEITADATSGLSIPIPFDVRIIDVIVNCTAANANGTVTLKNGSTAISDAIACVTNHVTARSGTLDDAQVSVGESDSILAVAHGAADRGVVSILALRV